MFKYYIIYKITNNINGKIYIGKHKCNNLDDGYFGSGKILQMAINKYGIENFTFHLEFILHNQEEMDMLEECVVNKDFLSRDDVYNVSRGGKNPCMYGEENPFYGKTHSELVKYNTSVRFKGKNISEEHKKHISDGLKKTYIEHPEIKLKIKSTMGKKICINKKTGERKYFYINNIPDGFEIYIKPKKHVSDETKIKNKEKLSERSSGSRWYNNGVKEKFCLEGTQPYGYIIGRLPTINIGRKYSEETIKKMSESKKGKPPPNKGMIFITNGVENKYINSNCNIPEGWHRGITRRKKK